MPSIMHQLVLRRIEELLAGEDDWISAMATVVSELHNTFNHFHWTGFYRTVRPNHLKVGPYQGEHGCIEIPFDKGICGAAARTAKTQNVPDVHSRLDHIACSSRTNSEVVVPVISKSGKVFAVLDVDSYIPSAFSEDDIAMLESICSLLGNKFGESEFF